MATMDVELFECERYRLLNGWSDKKYRIRSSNKFWRTLEEVDEALLAPGWAWEQVRDDSGVVMSWVPDLWCADVDTEGWSYASSFSSSFDGGSAKISLQKVVRWRRFVRTQTFSGLAALAEALAYRYGIFCSDFAGDGGCGDSCGGSPCGVGSPFSNPSSEGEVMFDAREAMPPPPLCPNVDLEGASHIQRSLLDAIVQASLYGAWSAHELVQLKVELLESLVGTQDGAATLEEVLVSFVSAKRGMSARMSQAFSRTSQSEQAAARRLQEVEARFPKAEMEAFTVIAIRRFRPDLACGVRDAAHEPHVSCEFRPVVCENYGCQFRGCAKDLPKHDDVCPHKLVACIKCAEQVPRKELKMHALMACPEREAKCLFSCIGCEAPLVHRNVNDHLEECTQAHLMLLMRELLQQRDGASRTQERIEDLEAQCAQARGEKAALQQRCSSMEQKVVGLDTNLGTLEKQVVDNLKKATGPLQDLKKSFASGKAEAKKRLETSEKDARKRVDGMEKCYKAEIHALRTEVATLRDASKDVNALRSAVEALKGGLHGLESKVIADAKVES